VAEGVGWDIFTLFFAVPALILSLPAVARGSLRGKICAAGILSYLFYQYLMYSTAWAFGPLFLPFIFIYGASFTAIILIVSSIRIAELPDRFSGRFPRKGMAALCFLMGSMLIGQTTLVVQALDLGLIVPLAFITGVLILRSKPAGFLLASVFAVKAFSMASAICAMLLSAWAYEGSLEVPPLIIFTSAAAASLMLGIKMYRSVIPPATSIRI
jgi:hypothetical protein